MPTTGYASYQVSALLICAVLAGAAAPPAFATEQHRFNIPAEAASDAIRDFGTQARVEILVAGENVSGKKLRAVSGTLSTKDGLTALLLGSGLTYRYVGQRSIALVALSTSKTNVAPATIGKASRSFSRSFRMAQVAQGEVSSAATVGNGTSSPVAGTAQLQEVVVTAQKREQNVLDVPVPVTVINADALVQQNQLRLQDYYSKVPGLNLELDGTTGAPTVSIRGITTGGQTNPTVGITVDDVPYGSPTFIGGGFVSPDLDPTDLAHIEVLRGPQGTLYGVSSIGGLIKYVTLDPSTSGFSGLVEAGTADVTNGIQPGYSMHGMVNAPLSEDLAFRATAFTRLDPGYLDNIQTGQQGVNWGTADGAHVSGLWKPLQNLSVKLSALVQDTNVHGSPLADSGPGFGVLQQSFLRGTGGYTQRFQAYSASIKAKLGAFDITSVTGYGIIRSSLSYDLTPLYGPYMFFGVAGSPYDNQLGTSKVSQELRVSGPLLRKLDWLLGLFYTRESSSYVSEVFAQAPTGAIVGQSLYYTNPSTYQEEALFTDFTYHFTDRLDVQMGGRESHISQNNSAYGSGPANGGVSVTPNAASSANSFTYLLTPEFKITRDWMLYARLASGYRAGGPNANALVNHVPPQYDPDKTDNYDLGLKAALLEHRLTIDAALYYIDWKNVQVTVEAPTGSAVYITNGGGAKSQGLEFSVEARPVPGLDLAAWVAWNEAVLTKDFPVGSSAYGVTGDRLPYSSRFSGSLSVDKNFSLSKDLEGFVGGNVNYVGDRVGLFQSTVQRQPYPGYAKIDLHAGLRQDTWSVNLYVNNLADRRAPLQGGLDGPNTYADTTSFIYVEPRTAGLSVSYRF